MDVPVSNSQAMALAFVIAERQRDRWGGKPPLGYMAAATLEAEILTLEKVADVTRQMVEGIREKHLARANRDFANAKSIVTNDGGFRIEYARSELACIQAYDPES